MDEQEVFRYSLPLKTENLAEYFTKISGWFSLHSTDKISPITKIRRCATELKLDVNNWVHLNFITTAFVQTFAVGDEAKKAFDAILQQQIDLKDRSGLEFQ